MRHEKAYLEHLERLPLSVALVNEVDEVAAVAKTHEHMQCGVEVIAQGALSGINWFGRPDILRRVQGRSVFGDWSYEVYDCKLAAETKATALLQLALYSDLLGSVQGCAPDCMYVVPTRTEFKAESYRIAEYSAYYRYIKKRFEGRCDDEGAGPTYPEPCSHCDVCRWFGECDAKRRSDDHFSLVAGVSHQQRGQLDAWNVRTVSQLAVLPIPIVEKPKFGSREGYERVREQARVQCEGREANKLVCETLPPTEGAGFFKLPEPCAHDMFVDLEGTPSREIWKLRVGRNICLGS